MMALDADKRTRMLNLLLEAINSLIVSLESGLGFDEAMYQYSQEADNELSQASWGYRTRSAWGCDAGRR